MKKIIFLLIAFSLSSNVLSAYYYDQYNQGNQVAPITEPGDKQFYPIIAPNQAPSDKELTEKIQALFRQDPILAPYASSIEVYSLNGAIVLAGIIDSDRVKLRAESQVKHTTGVKSVDNRIVTEKTK